jgi:pyruvate,water dikinase
MTVQPRYIVWLSEPAAADVATVGGKNASLGEMTQQLVSEGIAVPDGYATSVAAYWDFLDASGLRKTIEQTLDAYKRGGLSLQDAGATIRDAFLRSDLPPAVADAIVGLSWSTWKRGSGDCPRL